MRTNHLIAAACLAVLGFSASAQTPQPAVVAPGAPPAAVAPGPMMRQHSPGMMQQFMQQRRAEREARLKQILQIAPAQEGAWNAWVAARQPAAMQRPDRRELASLPTPERIDRMRALRNARIAEMDRRAEATKTFYAALTPAQQKSFDALAAERMGRHGGGHHGDWMQRG
jgi:Spy/CpxP family protein refolding chaperone